MVFQIILEILIVFIGCFGMLMHSGWVTGKPRKDFFRYYTNLSNLLVLMFYLIRTLVRITGNYDGFFGRIVFKEIWFYSVTMSILLTFVIFHFVLLPSLKNKPSGSDEFKFIHSFSNYCVHYIIPLMSLLNWLIFADKTQLQYAWAVIWTVIPWIYVIYAIIRGLHGDIIENTDTAYPYPFIDISKYGWGIVIRNCIVISIAGIAAGALLIFIRKLI